MKNTFIIITADKYPNGDAGAVREHAFALILKKLGYTPVVIGMGPSSDFKEKTYDGISYYSLRYKSANVFFRVLGRLNFKKNSKKILRKFNRNKIKGILYVSGTLSTFKYITKFASKNGIALYHDSVEWYSPEQFANGEKNKTLKRKNKLNSELLNDKWNVIAISSYLEEHFKKQCKSVVRIPVIMDMSSIEARTERASVNEKVKFVYAGAPGKKDYLKDLIEGFSLLSPDLIDKLELNIIGVTKTQLIEICDVSPKAIEILGSALISHGRVPREQAVEWVRSADFTLLLRDENLRYAKAGFPTKIVESLACGTPPLCNYSSDLHMYLEDGKNAFIIDGHTAQDVCNTIVRILSLNNTSLELIRKNARMTAELHFDYKKYESACSEFFA